jgi:pimeloyl-ACP methyl ester carboxylesterase
MRKRVPLLLLPGMLCDARFWHAQMNAIADICEPRVVSYGQADSIGAMAAGVLAGAPDNFAVAGHSMGGRIALEVCRRAPERVIKLALMCTDYRAPVNLVAGQAEAAERDQWLAVARARGMRGFAEYWLPEIVAPDRQKDAALVREIVEMMACQSTDALAAQTRAGLTRPDYTELLPEIACPTLICAGALDKFRPIGPHREMAAQIAGSELAIIQGSGHMVAMEQPDAVTRAIRNWLLS